MEEKKKKQTKRKRVTSVSPNQNKPSSLAHKGTWQHVMDDFLFWKKAQGVSETTIKGYSNHIRHFFTRFEDIWGEDELIRQAIMEHMADDIKPATYNLRLIYLRAFFDWAIKEVYVNSNPLEDYKKRKADARIVDIPVDTLQKLLSTPDQKTFAGLRDYGLMLLTLDTGVRPKEAFQLTIQEFDLAHYHVNIPAEVSKTRHARTLPILPHTTEVIKKLIRVRPDDWEDNIPVFCNNEGGSLTRHTWNDRLEYYSEKIGFKIRPYDLRHSFAIMFLRNGGNAFSLQKMMGHENMDMTKRYLNITGQDLREAHQQASPVHSLIPKKKTRVRKL